MPPGDVKQMGCEPSRPGTPFFVAAVDVRKACGGSVAERAGAG
jgi:hypothetical protein